MDDALQQLARRHRPERGLVPRAHVRLHGAMQSEDFQMELKGPDASGLLHESNSAGSKYVVMPMRL